MNTSNRESNFTTAEISAYRRLRVNVKSIAAEIRIIRLEEKKTTNSDVRSQLRSHRTDYLRRIARIANLALAAVRGRQYRETERAVKLGNEVPIGDLQKKFDRLNINIDARSWLTT